MGRSPYPQVWSRFDGTLRQIKATTQFCALPGRKLVDHVLNRPSDKALVTSYSLRSFRHRYGARHCSSLSPKESSGCFSPRPIVFSPSIQYLPIGKTSPRPTIVTARAPRRRGYSGVRLPTRKLVLHPEKTKIVYCKDVAMDVPVGRRQGEVRICEF